MKTLKRIGLVFVVIILAAPFILYFITKHQTNIHNGRYTDIIDPTPFVDMYSAIQIRNAYVLNPKGTEFKVANVILKNGKIFSIDSIGRTQPHVTVIDATGKYLIPGLIDTHVHLHDSKNDLYLYLANGVTSVCELFGWSSHLKWREEAENGAISPNIFVASSKVMSARGFFPGIEKYFGYGIQFDTEEKARKGVRKFKKEGYEAVKLSGNLSLEIYKVIADEAKKQNLPIVGHLSNDIGLKNLDGNGLKYLAHSEEVTKNLKHTFGRSYEDPEGFLTYVSERVDSIAKQLKKNNISVITTNWLCDQFITQGFHLEDFLKDIDLKYANPGLVEGSDEKLGWLPGNSPYEQSEETKSNSENREKTIRFLKAIIEANHKVTQAMIKNDVTLLAGTDSNVAGAVPGFALHLELQSLQDIGLSNDKILKSATNEAAKFMKRKTGKIEVGYQSDLLLLSKNPLEDIKNTKSIENVFFGSYMMDKNQINAMLKAVESANNDSRKVQIEEYIDR